MDNKNKIQVASNLEIETIKSLIDRLEHKINKTDKDFALLEIAQFKLKAVSSNEIIDK